MMTKIAMNRTTQYFNWISNLNTKLNDIILNLFYTSQNYSEPLKYGIAGYVDVNIKTNLVDLKNVGKSVQWSCNI